MAFLDNVQAALSGNAQGSNFADQVMPSASQSQGAPAMNNPAIEMVQNEINELNKIAFVLRQQGDNVNDKRVINCVFKMQEVLLDLKKQLAEDYEDANA